MGEGQKMRAGANSILVMCPSAAVCVALALCLTLKSANAMELLGGVGGRIGDYAIEGDRLYVGEGLRLVIYDISDPASPRIASSVDFTNYREESAAHFGTISFVAVRESQVFVDITYLGLFALDARDLAAISVKRLVAESSRFHDSAILGTFLLHRSTYSSEDGASYFELSDPRNPRRVIAQDARRRSSNYVLVPPSLFYPSFRESAYKQMDLRDGKIVRQIEIGNLFDLGSLLSEDALLQLGEQGLVFKSPSDTDAPVTILVPAQDLRTILCSLDDRFEIRGSRVFNGGPNGWVLSELSTRERPLAEETSTESDFEFEYRGDQVFWARDGDVHFLDITAAEPKPWNVDFGRKCERLRLWNSLAAVEGERGELSLWETGDPSAPRLLAEIPRATSPFRVRVLHNRAFVALATGGLACIDISNPKAPALASIEFPEESYRDMELLGQELLLSRKSGGIRDLTLTDTAEIQSSRIIGESNYYDRLAADGEFVCANQTNGAISAFKVGSEGRLEAYRSYAPDRAEDADLLEIDVSNGQLYFVGRNEGLAILSLDDDDAGSIGRPAIPNDELDVDSKVRPYSFAAYGDLLACEIVDASREVVMYHLEQSNAYGLLGAMGTPLDWGAPSSGVLSTSGDFLVVWHNCHNTGGGQGAITLHWLNAEHPAAEVDRFVHLTYRSEDAAVQNGLVYLCNLDMGLLILRQKAR